MRQSIALNLDEAVAAAQPFMTFPNTKVVDVSQQFKEKL